MSEIPCRPPIHKEAVEIVLRSLTQRYRCTCIEYWRAKYGDGFADRVEVEARARFGKERAK